MIKMLMGAVFLAISFIRIRAIMDWQIVAVIFDYTFFFFGGIVLLVLGALLFIAKVLIGGKPISTFNSSTTELTLRGKSIPFSKIDEIKLQASGVLVRNTVVLLFRQNGKIKALLAGTMIMSDTEALQNFIARLHEMVNTN
jgi:hypothetical protein